jgi:hypothetical protein
VMFILCSLFELLLRWCMYSCDVHSCVFSYKLCARTFHDQLLEKLDINEEKVRLCNFGSTATRGGASESALVTFILCSRSNSAHVNSRPICNSVSTNARRSVRK